MGTVTVNKRKVKTRPNQSKEEIIQESIGANEEYFQCLASLTGQDIDELREQHRQELEELLAGYIQGEGVELEICEVVDLE